MIDGSSPSRSSSRIADGFTPAIRSATGGVHVWVRTGFGVSATVGVGVGVGVRRPGGGDPGVDPEDLGQRPAGGELPEPVRLPGGDRSGEPEYFRGVRPGDHDQAAAVGADDVAGFDDHSAALDRDVQGTWPFVRPDRGMGAAGESGQPQLVETLDVPNRSVHHQSDRAVALDRAPDDVPDQRGVDPSTAVDHEHVAGFDQVR